MIEVDCLILGYEVEIYRNYYDLRSFLCGGCEESGDMTFAGDCRPGGPPAIVYQVEVSEGI